MLRVSVMVARVGHGYDHWLCGAFPLCRESHADPPVALVCTAILGLLLFGASRRVRHALPVHHRFRCGRSRERVAQDRARARQHGRIRAVSRGAVSLLRYTRSIARDPDADRRGDRVPLPARDRPACGRRWPTRIPRVSSARSARICAVPRCVSRCSSEWRRRRHTARTLIREAAAARGDMLAGRPRSTGRFRLPARCVARHFRGRTDNMSRKFILKGDTTDHGGVVLEGSPIRRSTDANSPISARRCSAPPASRRA